MNGKKRFIPVILLLLCLGIATAVYPTLKKNYTNQQLTKKATTQETDLAQEPTDVPTDLEIAPDFTVTDINGNEVHLSDFKGKPVIMNFWASWCGYCDDEMPAFQKVYEAHKEDVVFLMININDGQRETVESAKIYMEEKGLTLPIYFSNMGDVVQNYDVTSLPTTYLIDKEGNRYGYAKGAMDADALETALSEMK